MMLFGAHEGEEFFSLGWPEALMVLAVLLIVLYLVRIGKAPDARTVREVVAVLNTKGGNIALLAGFSLYFFSKAMQFFYHALGLMVEKAITPENAVLMMGVAFVTGTAFGGAFGALITLLSGENRQTQRSSDKSQPPPTTIEAPKP